MTKQKIRITRSQASERHLRSLKDIPDFPVPESYSDTDTLAQTVFDYGRKGRAVVAKTDGNTSNGDQP